MKKFISFFIVLYIAWIAFAGFTVQELILGFIVSIIITLIMNNSVTYYWKVKNFSSVFKFIILYIPLFVYKLVQANLEMAKIVLSPSTKTNSGFVTIHTGLKSDVGKFVLANSITLTPGTITVDINENELFIHWVDIKGKDNNDYFKNIAGDFEKVLRRIFE